MATSNSKPGKAKVIHEAGDTFIRTYNLSYKSSGLPIVLTGATITVIISTVEDGTATATLTAGAGLITSDLANGEIKIFWQTAGVLTAGVEYWYKVKVTFPDGRIKTYIEDTFTTV